MYRINILIACRCNQFSRLSLWHRRLGSIPLPGYFRERAISLPKTQDPYRLVKQDRFGELADLGGQG